MLEALEVHQHDRRTLHLFQLVDGDPETFGAKAARGEIGLHVEHREANLADRFAVALFPHRAERHRFGGRRSEEHTSELQSLMRISYAGFCLKKKNNKTQR